MKQTNFQVIDIDLPSGKLVNGKHLFPYSCKCENPDLDRVNLSYVNVVTGESIQFDNIDVGQMEVAPPSPVPHGVYDVRIQKSEPVTVVSGPRRIVVGEEETAERFVTEHTVEPDEFGTLRAVSPVGRYSLSGEQETVTFRWEHDGAPPLCYQVNLFDQKTDKCIKIWRDIASEQKTLTVQYTDLCLGSMLFYWRVVAIYLQRNIISENSALEIPYTLKDTMETNPQRGLETEAGPFDTKREEVVRIVGVGVCFKKSGGNSLKKMNLNLKSLLRSSRQEEKFWALKDVSLCLEHGDILGVIGNNGAGKSTLLKVLTGVLLADNGSVAMHGRVSSLLALGAGFMPYLSGRENIYLNGMYMGMSKEKIGKIFDEIVEFSELAAFIDTPIRYYSSGMKARLGFSVAVHVDPEILVVDEVLATGDKNFRAKAEQKMRSFMDKAKVLIIASHSMKLISDLTNKCLYLDKGTVKQFGPTHEVVAMYNKN